MSTRILHSYVFRSDFSGGGAPRLFLPLAEGGSWFPATPLRYSAVRSLSLPCCPSGCHPHSGPSCLGALLPRGAFSAPPTTGCLYLCSRGLATCRLRGGLPPPIPSPPQLAGKGSLARARSEHGFRPAPPAEVGCPKDGCPAPGQLAGCWDSVPCGRRPSRVTAFTALGDVWAWDTWSLREPLRSRAWADLRLCTSGARGSRQRALGVHLEHRGRAPFLHTRCGLAGGEQLTAPAGGGRPARAR